MNVGYSKLDNDVDDEVCPICGKNIYISKYYNDYACVDNNCPLGHGANKLIKKIDKVLIKLKK